MRKTLIFGNGLGMALDARHFSLANALNDVWDGGSVDDAHKKMIAACLLPREVRCPQSEDELDLLHNAVTSCELLRKINAPSRIHFLTPHGWDFPAMCRAFIAKVATRLFDYQGGLPHEFANSLAGFLRDTKSHVATLNYDKLLYDFLIESGLVDGYSGSLVDGFLSNGFRRQNLVRKYDNGFGYYLHLHGSPLFMDREGVPVKIPRRHLDLEQREPTSHIVLTHIQHKPSVIASSPVLSAYWDYLALAISESSEVVLFGCSGGDMHVNQLLATYSGMLTVRVVEWRGAGAFKERQRFWENALGSAIELDQRDSLMDFDAW